MDNPPETEPRTIKITLQVPKCMEIDEDIIQSITDNAQMDLDMWYVRKNLARHQAAVAENLVRQAGVKKPTSKIV